MHSCLREIRVSIGNFEHNGRRSRCRTQTVAGCFESGGYKNGADICRDETNCKSETQPGIRWHGLGGLAFNLDFDMAPGLCQEFHEHVDTEAIDLSSNQVANTRLVDTK